MERREWDRPVPIVETTEVALRHGIVLPQEVIDIFNAPLSTAERNAYILALRSQDWTLQSIATAANLTRERVRQIEMTTNPIDAINLLADPRFIVPAVPTKTVEKVVGYSRNEPKPETLARLKELQPLAQQVRYDHLQYRAEAEEYTALLWEAHDKQKVSIKHLSRLLGVTHGAIRFRLVRYGYLPSSGQSISYTPVKTKNRAI